MKIETDPAFLLMLNIIMFLESKIGFNRVYPISYPFVG